jgi:hypothetical protein
MKLPPLTVTWKECEEAWEAAGERTPIGKMYSAVDLLEGGQLQEQFFLERLVYDPKVDVLHLRFRYDYEVDTERITKPMHLLRWVAHLSEKTWMNATFLGEFIKKVCEIKGWDLYRGRD